jgi:GxxExxY protein
MPDAAMPIGPEYRALSERIIAAAIEVHRALGPGLLEAVYKEALEIEFKERGIEFEREKSFQVRYKGHLVGEGRLDFLVAKLIVVEIKAVSQIVPVHQAQILHYLAFTNCRLGLLITFHKALLHEGIQRVAL